MNDNILRAIESLCDDIATNTNAEDNQKRANAILALAFGGIFTGEEIKEDCAEDNSAVRTEKGKIKYPKPGEQFEYNGIKFTALGEEQGGVLAIVSKLLKDFMKFDTNNGENSKANWNISSLRKYLNGEYLEKFNSGDLLPFVSDLTSDDGMKNYGTAKDYIFLLSCDLYRKYRELIPVFNYSWWTITPRSCHPGISCNERIVSMSSTLSSDRACFDHGVAPACLFNPKIFE